MVKETRIIMGMPVTVEIVGAAATQELIAAVFAYFTAVDEKFSTYKDCSEISRINRQELSLDEASQDMQTIFALAEQFRLGTHGYFNIQQDGKYDPSGLVKGWAIYNAAEMIRQHGFESFYVEAGGDIQVAGKNEAGQNWQVGIRNPFNLDEIIKVLHLTDGGIATSGTYVRGQHIYNPLASGIPLTNIISLTVIGPDIVTADCFATAAFAMGKDGIIFIENLDGFEGYMIDGDERATFTSGFWRYVNHA